MKSLNIPYDINSVWCMAVAEGPFHTPALRVAFRANAENRILSHPPVSNRRLTNIHQHSIPSFLSSLSHTRNTACWKRKEKRKKIIKYRNIASMVVSKSYSFERTIETANYFTIIRTNISIDRDDLIQIFPLKRSLPEGWNFVYIEIP